MKTDKNGCSTLIGQGTESYEFYTVANGKDYCQYDYRDIDNQLFSCVKPTLEKCREARDAWIAYKTKYN